MEIEKIAPAAASGQNIPGTAQSSGAQNSEIDELQRLADSIRNMENDCRVTARIQGLSGSGLQTKLRQYDELLAKIKEQIRRLEHEKRQDSGKTAGFSMLQYSTSAAQISMRSSGKTASAVAAGAMQTNLASAQQKAVLQKPEVSAAAAEQTPPASQVSDTNQPVSTGGAQNADSAKLNMLV